MTGALVLRGSSGLATLVNVASCGGCNGMGMSTVGRPLGAGPLLTYR